MLKAVPAERVEGVPVFPVAVPGAAVSPGNNICNLLKAAAFTVVEGLVFAVRLVVVTSEAVSVREPDVFNVTEKLFVPDTNAAFAGNSAFASVDVNFITSLAELTTFQAASTPFTVTEIGVPAVIADGVPVLPVDVPGAAVSPGNNI